MTARKTLAHLPPQHRLSAARMQAYELMPYFRSGVMSLIPHSLPGFGTLGVTKGNHLLIDFDILGDWTVTEAAAVILHEYMHRFSRHAERFEYLIKTGAATADDARLWNIAADAEINNTLRAAGCDLPDGGGVTSATIGMNPNCLAEVYFDQLKYDADAAPIPACRCIEGSGVGGDATKHPDEPSEAASPGRTQAEQARQYKQDAESIQTAARGCGYVPDSLVRQAAITSAPPKVPWFRKLAVACRNSVARKSGFVDYDFTCRSREQCSLDMMLGRRAPQLPAMDAPVVSVAFAIDTSGSMSPGQLQTLVREAGGVIQHMGGARITFLSCDAMVHTVTKVSSPTDIVKNLKGGGGTDFRPVFKHIDSMPKSQRPAVLIFGTDGYGPAPKTAPKGMKVIWLVVDGASPCEWGEHIHIEGGELE